MTEQVTEQTYRMRLGDFIREVDVRNTGLNCKNLLGLSISKMFIPSIANTIGTDLRNYKLVRKGQFGYVPVTSRNGDKITVALYDNHDDCIVSQAYTVFEVIDPTVLMPEYLMMWFRRPEFDRYARFHSHGSAREVFDWDEMCNVMLPIPPIEEQREIVARHQAIERRIEINRKTIARLEEVAQAIYRKMFVDGIDPENLPDGWRLGTISEIIDLTICGDWGKETQEGNYDSYVVCLRGADIMAAKRGLVLGAPKRYILKKNIVSRKLEIDDIVIEMSGGTPTQSTGRAVLINDKLLNEAGGSIICSNFCKVIRARSGWAGFLYLTLLHLYSNRVFFKYENSSNGIQNLDFEALSNEESIIIPDVCTLSKITNYFIKMYDLIHLLGKENGALYEVSITANKVLS